MSAFANAQNILVTNAQFVDHSVQNLNISSRLTGIDILLKESIPDATYDSRARDPPPQCFPGTREQYIEDITRWAVPSLGDNPLPIYWMKGPAGVGKTAIAQTCVEKLKDMGQLGAAFFFSINGRDDHTRFFTSLAYQLSTEFPDYRNLLDKKICQDKTLVSKALVWQFGGLIVEPLQELERVGKGVGKRAIFVDGLDECRSKDAQSEIVKIISSSVREHTTPFCWAFFSRPEPHIEATFSREDISFLCHQTILPMSREADQEIELYLSNGFQNILRRRNVSMAAPWPSREDMKMLVAAAAGLFVYASMVLRFVDYSSSLGLEEALCAILAVISRHDRNPTAITATSQPFSELDAFYSLIMKRVDNRILPSAQLLLATMLLGSFDTDWSAVLLSNRLGFSEVKLRTICNELHAVVRFRDWPEPFDLDDAVDVTRPFYHAGLEAPEWLRRKAYGFGGIFSLYHKSFYDFLRDPARSDTFCITTPVMRNCLFKHCLQRCIEFEKSYTIQGSDLVLVPGMRDSAASLSWPYTNEYVNSYLKAQAFNNACLTLHILCFSTDLDSQVLKDFAGADFRKALLNDAYLFPEGGPLGVSTWNCPSIVKRVRGTLLSQIPQDEFQGFDVDNFQKMIEKLRVSGVIRPYSPTLTSWCKSILRKKQGSKVQSSLYAVGRGPKKIFWYWEFDCNLQCYREFVTPNLTEGQKLYQQERFNLWESELENLGSSTWGRGGLRGSGVHLDDSMVNDRGSAGFSSSPS